MNKTALDDPYLRAAFSFLTSPSEKYEVVLVRDQAVNPVYDNICYVLVLNRTKQE